MLSKFKKLPKSPEALAEGVDKLATLPEVYYVLRNRLNDPRAGSREIAQVINKDAALTARLLKMVNSAVFGPRARVDSISRAVSMVGTRELEFLVLATSAFETFSRLSSELVSVATFWRHSVFCAVASRILARQCNVLHPERLFVAGLMHDVGSLALYHQVPDVAREVLERSQEGAEPTEVVEKELLGYDHAEVGGALARQWRFPEALEEAIRCHHRPDFADAYALEAAIVHVANMMTVAMEINDDEEFREICDPAAWRLLRLSETRIRPVFQEAVHEFLEVLEQLSPGNSKYM